MAQEDSPEAAEAVGPLHEHVIASRLRRNRPFHRALLLFRAALFILFLAYRVHSLLTRRRRCTQDGDELCRFNGELEVAALICEVWFCVSVVVGLSSRWWLVERVTYPHRLVKRIKELPAVDVFVTSADPVKEPPLVTMNTILSALAIDYPTQKLSCYVSDDGGSLLTLWSLKETTRFAKHAWLPFCTKFSCHIHPRAPGPYFSRKNNLSTAIKYGFENEWHDIKEKYHALATKISSMTAAYCKSQNDTLEILMKELKASSTSDRDQPIYLSWALNYDPCNHSSHCEILVDRPPYSSNVDSPYLVYLSREKHPKKKHHFKAGAMNSLLRVSGIMTNAPFVLNLDCDMYVNAPNSLLQAMCIFMDYTGKEVRDDTGFVQFPQCFEDVHDDDVYGSSMSAAIEIFFKGMDGVQGPPYCGTGCIHKRESLYGKCPHFDASHMFTNDRKLGHMFGRSKTLTQKAEEILSCTQSFSSYLTTDALIRESNALMGCDYEQETYWGREVGLIYGSLTEDIMTGLKIQSRGWKSVTCTPYPSAFLGCVPSTSEDNFTTRKRWSMGQLEILFSSISPLLVKNTQGLSLMQRFVYIYIFDCVLLCLPLFVYSLVPALSLLGEKPIFPKVVEPAILIPLSVIGFTYVVGIYENKIVGVGLKRWWNSERMEYIVAISSSFFALYEVLKKKMLGSTEITFTITPKYQNGHGLEEKDNEQKEPQQEFEVNSTQPIFILPTILVIYNLVALSVAFSRILRGRPPLNLCPPTEVACSLGILFLLYPFTKGFFLWLVGQSGPLVLSSSTILHALMIVVSFFLFTIYI